MSTSPRTWVQRALHLLALWSFAVAQPVYDVLARNAEFLVIRRTTPGDLGWLILVGSGLLPLALLGLEFLLHLISRRWSTWAHAGILAGLLAVLSSGALARNASDPVAWGTGAALGVLALAGFLRSRRWQTVLPWFSPVALVFPLLFALRPAIRPVLSPPPAPTAIDVDLARTPPIVMVVLDELPLTSLQDEAGALNAGLFPNLARLAATATWYPNATTVAAQTEFAVPAILTGRNPRPGRYPVAADHPRNLFTLLGRHYEIRARESVTVLCPPSLHRGSPLTPVHRPGVTDLLRDTGVIALHVILPARVGQSLPPIDLAWSGFVQAGASAPASLPAPAEDQDEVPDHILRARTALRADRKQEFLEFVDSLSAGPTPTLSFLHVLLPHQLWEHLPSGRSYNTFGSRLPGTVSGDRSPTRWGPSEWPIVEAYQRHLLQAMFVDALVGQLLDRLEALGTLDETMLVLLADHGCAFVPGQPFRDLTPQNAGDVMPVPLFLKVPGQTQADVDPRPASVIDVLPTLVDALGAAPGWDFDGASLLGPANAPAPTVRAWDSRRTELAVERTDLTEQARARLHWRQEQFGLLRGVDDLYRFGPHRDLVGRRVDSLPLMTGSGRIECDQLNLLARVYPAGGSVPCYLRGSVVRPFTTSEPLTVMAAVNDRLVAGTRTRRPDRGRAEWFMHLPESALRPEGNRVELFVVHGRDDDAALEPPARASHNRYRLEPGVIVGEGFRFPVRPPNQRDIHGRVFAEVGPEWITISGWAIDVKGAARVDQVVAFRNGDLLYAGATDIARPGAAGRVGPEALLCGYTFTVPGSMVATDDPPEIRVFALARGHAIELTYHPDYRWAPR